MTVEVIIAKFSLLKGMGKGNEPRIGYLITKNMKREFLESVQEQMIPRLRRIVTALIGQLKKRKSPKLKAPLPYPLY